MLAQEFDPSQIEDEKIRQLVAGLLNIIEATLVGHHGTSKIMSSEKSLSKREGHLIKKICGQKLVD